MLCSNFEQRMHELLDARQRPEYDDELADHATRCRACTEVLVAQKRLFGSLQQTGQADPLGDLPERVVSIAVTRRWMRTFAPIFAAAALAASLLFILVPAFRPAQHAGLALVPGDLTELAADSRPHFVDADTTEIDAEQYRALIQGLIVQVHRLPQLQQVDQIAGSIRPLASTLNVAIDMLWRRTFAGGSGYRPKGTESRESRVRSHSRFPFV